MLVAGPLDVFVLASTGMFWKLRWNHGIDPLALEDAQVRGLHEVPHDVLADGDQGGHQTTPRRKPSWWWYLHLTATCSESALHKTLEDAKVLGEHILDGDLSKHVVVKVLPKLHVDLVHEKIQNIDRKMTMNVKKWCGNSDTLKMNHVGWHADGGSHELHERV